MPGGKKSVVVLSVLMTGVSTALFFRKDASQEDYRHEASLENPFRQRVERRVVADTTWTRNLQTARPKLASRSSDAQRVPATASIPQGLTAESQPTIQRNFNPVGALLEPIENIPPEEDDPQSAASSTLTGLETNSPAGATLHRIVDGDTLSKLAVEYLGRAERYLEIYEINRDVLSSPDLLPIGVTLKIPAWQKAQPPANPSSEPWAPSSSDDPLPLAPVPAGGGAR
jgi:nucleoid-associated protein YgaU